MIFDQDGNPVSSFSTSIEAGEVQIYNLKIACKSRYSLFADVVGDLVVEAKRTSDMSWINIETTPITINTIDLATWDNTTQDFQMRLTAAAVTSAVRRAFSLRVAHI